MKILKNNWLRASLSAIVLLFGVFFIVQAMGNSEPNHAKATPENNTLLMTNWVFTPNVSSNPLDPENYEEASTSHCTGTKEVCGIKAPTDANGYPVITPGSDLATRIQNKDASKGDVFLKGN